MTQWTLFETKIKELGLIPEKFRTELINSYLDGKGGKDAFRPRDLETNNVMKALGLWKLNECNKVKENNMHQASSCTTLIAVLTIRGREVARELIDEKISGLKDNRLIKKMPSKVLSLFIELLIQHENELSMEIITSYFNRTFANNQFPFLHQCPISPLTLLFPTAEQYLSSFVSFLSDFGTKEVDKHNTKGWFKSNSFRTCAEVVNCLRLMTNLEWKETEKALIQLNGSSFGKLEILLKLEKDGLVNTKDLEEAGRFANDREGIRSFLRNLHEGGYITPRMPTLDLPCIQRKELDEVRKEIYNTMKAENERFWLERMVITDASRRPITNDKIAIIDVSNVAFDNVPKGQKASYDQVVSASTYYKDNGFEVVLIADPSLRHKIDNVNEFQSRISRCEIEQSPKGIRADGYILKLAKEKYPNAIIVTNDAFLDQKLLRDYSTIIANPSRFKRYKIHKGEFFPLNAS
jgi:hypothetical protein